MQTTIHPPDTLATAAVPRDSASAEPVLASTSQRRAIEADPGPLLVLAGPGAGKTYCLIERIAFLVDRHDADPSRICAFTFTNKAAGEIAHRLQLRLGDAAAEITRGTIHAFCAALLRELGSAILLERGFGIADEEYQLNVLRRLEGPKRWHKSVLTRFSAHRFRGDTLQHEDLILFHRYQQYLEDRRVLDFDSLVLKAVELLESPGAPDIRTRWDVLLVDEFQDLNPVQYRVVRALARDHRHVFAVGDDEQSIYSWAGADPAVFRSFVNDFGITSRIHLEENHRCAREVFALARKLVTINTPLFADRVIPRADRESPFPVSVRLFASDDAESAWLVDDLRRDRCEHDTRWGDVAILYRTHGIGERLESALLNAGIPCRLAQGRALGDDPAVSYVLAACRVIARPDDDVIQDAFFKEVLPTALFDEALARAESARHTLTKHLAYIASRLPKGHENKRQIRRALVDYRNLVAVGRQHPTIAALVRELLSRKVGKLRSSLDDRHDEITDPAGLPDVAALAARLRAVRNERRPIWIARCGGAEIAIKGMLAGIGIQTARYGDPPSSDGERLVPTDVASIGFPLGVFKAAQLIEMGETDADHAAFSSFTAIDIETTGKDIERAEIVEVAAVRVRDGQIVDKWSSLVKPSIPIEPDATRTHTIRDQDVATAPRFADIWPRFRDFCGDDVIVAHNGYQFDFRILGRMARSEGKAFDLCTYDTLPLARDLYPTSRALPDLARQFGIATGRSHRALDDTVALANVCLALDEVKRVRSRKTALVNLLDHLGVALALRDESELCAEGKLFRDLARPFALSRHSGCLEWYEREHRDCPAPLVDELIDRLGGTALMERIRAERGADERYPSAMARLRRLIAEIPDGSLDEQLALFLERAALSKWDGHEPDDGRVNLLTLHSTKGLQFSRVYVVGVEDAQMPGGSAARGATPDEVEEARRLLYVGMTRTVDRLVLTRSEERGGKPTGGHRFLDEMELVPATAGAPPA